MWNNLGIISSEVLFSFILFWSATVVKELHVFLPFKHSHIFYNKFHVVFCNFTRVGDATLNIKLTTILMDAHLSNHCKPKAYQSMDDLSTPLTPTQPPVDSGGRVRLVSSPMVQR